ncbi:dolichol kinase [Halorubraceae archaeon YAN]|nr:dolichol kinase [Halorubraceae archaeon YAN]
MSLELGRRAVHASGVGIPLLYLLNLATWTQVRYVLLLATAIVFILEFLRLGVGLNHRIYDELTREYEQESIAGYALYMISMSAVGLMFTPVVAIPAMLMLSIGDPISGMLGSNGPHEHKAPQVWIAMSIVCFTLAAVIVVPAVGGLIAVLAAALGAVAAAIADGIKPIIRGIPVDDNLTIPPAGALGIAIVLWLGGVGPVVDPVVPF